MIAHILQNERLSREHRLCYIECGAAYFTDQFEGQWGDDWNDAPWIDNAGIPYSDTTHQGSGRGDIRVLHYEADLYAPGELGRDGLWTVEAINIGETPWLAPPDWADGGVEIHAGVDMHQFTRLILEAGGQVYAPIIWIGGHTNDKRHRRDR